MPIEINLFGKNIPTYGLLCVTGILASLVIAFLLAKKNKIDIFDFCIGVVFCLLGAFVGAKLLFIITSWETVKTIFASMPFFEAISILIRGGYVFYGGLIGGLIALLISLRIQKKDIFQNLNIFATVLPLGHAIGRIGCFVSGCCYGMEYDGPLSYTYTVAMDINTPIGVTLFPVQLVEALFLFALFFVLLFLYLKFKNKYLVTFVYCYSYAIIRFVLEFFRGDKIRGVYLLSTSQWISLLAIILCTIILIVGNTKKKKAKN